MSLLSTSHLTPLDHPSHPLSGWPSIDPHPLGRLVLLTPEVTLSASKSIITGKRFSLDRSIYPSDSLLHGRAPTTHTVERVDRGARTIEESGKTGTDYQPVFDCFVNLNTQSTTQWDYFMHYSYFGSGLFFGGLTAEKIQAEDTGDIGVGG